MRLRQIPGAVWGLLALALGMILGTAFPTELSFVGTGVSLAFKGLAWAAPYIIFFTIGAALVDMLRHGRAGKFAAWTGIVFTAIGLFAGLLAILLTVPLFGLSWGSGDANAPDLVARLAGEANLLRTPSLIAVVWSFVSVIGLHVLGKWAPAARVTRPTMDMLATIGRDGIQLVGKALKIAFPYLLLAIGIFIPTNVRSAVASTQAGISAAGPGVTSVFGSNPIALYLLTVCLQIIVFAVFMAIAVGAVCWYAGFPVRRFLREYFAYVYPFAWATSSSAASIPVNAERARDGLGARKEIVDFVIPLGATVNLDGAIMASFILTAMASILVGYKPTFVDLLILLIPIKIVTLGVPGIPGGVAAVVPPVVSEILPIPPDAKAAFLAIWFGFSVGLSDQFRTGVNTTTNGIVALGFEAAYDRHFAKDAKGESKGEEAERTPLGEDPA